MSFSNTVHVALAHGTQLLSHYGSIALFLLLAVGIVGLPIPDETLLVATGMLLQKGHLHPTYTILAALCGSVCGISLSYGIGRAAENLLIEKYGSWLGITEKRLVGAHSWFRRMGVWLLFFGYFIPFVRHLTGYVAGAVKLEYKKFAAFAYIGAIFWVTTFLTIGYMLALHAFPTIPHVT
jgi:membrane protein DedA with SNARE-associated domain